MMYNDFSNNCVYLATNNDIVYWGNNSTNMTIEVQPYMWTPILVYDEEMAKSGNSSVLHYQWCGPFIAILKLFARYINANVKILPHVEDVNSYTSDYLRKGVDNLPHLALFPYCPNPTLEDIRNSLNYKSSRFVGFFERSSLLSKTEKHARPLFDYFNCYDIEVYYYIVLSLLAFGLLFAVRNRSLSTFFSTFWDFASVILSDIIARRIVGDFTRVMAVLWLLCSLVLLTGFSAGLWNFMIHKDTIDRIDSWDDLHTKPQWKKMKIYSSYYFEMSDFILRDPSQMASDFKKRSVMFDPFNAALDHKLQENYMKIVTNGDVVLSLDCLLLHYLKVKFKDRIKHYGSEGFDYHISKSGFGMKPYFILFSPRSDSKLVNKFNTLQVENELTSNNNIFIFSMTRLIDMGIYEYEVRKSLRLNGHRHGPDINVEIDTDAYKFDAITLKQMKGVFIGILICHTFNICVFLMELLNHHYLGRICTFISHLLHDSHVMSYLLKFYYFYTNSNRVNPQ